MAVPTKLYDDYLKDVALSFVLFWVALGPTVYRSYFVDPLAEKKKEEEEKEDKYVKMLKKLKQE
jgi:hypothetical protein